MRIQRQQKWDRIECLWRRGGKQCKTFWVARKWQLFIVLSEVPLRSSQGFCQQKSVTRLRSVDCFSSLTCEEKAAAFRAVSRRSLRPFLLRPKNEPDPDRVSQRYLISPRKSSDTKKFARPSKKDVFRSRLSTCGGADRPSRGRFIFFPNLLSANKQTEA